MMFSVSLCLVLGDIKCVLMFSVK